MKKLIIAFLFFFCIAIVAPKHTFAQVSMAKNAISYKLIGTDYETVALGNFYEGGQMKVGAELAFSRFLNKSLNLNFPLRGGLMNYPLGDGQFAESNFTASLDANLVYKFNNGYILPEKSVIAPYLVAGIGANYLEPTEDHLDVQVPLGVGFNIRLVDFMYANIQGEYRLSLIEGNNPIVYSAGLTFVFGKDEEEPIIEEPLDTDGDGLADAVDDCPETPGPASLNGCPDRDEDGITDAADSCPDVAGLKAFDGCPDTDSDGLADGDDGCPLEAGPISNNGCPEAADEDGDGIVDSEDDCPKVAGLAAFNGCPDTDGDGIKDSDDDCPKKAGLAAFNGCPDTDSDGIKDGDDKCPFKAGPKSNKGCPELTKEDKEVLEFATRTVNFETGSARLTQSSYTNLDQVVAILKNNPAYSLRIGGHTDSVGSSATNQTLSESRAKSCYDYILTKSIAPSRVSYTGYGEDTPIASNMTKEGRATNRRVEFDVYLK